MFKLTVFACLIASSLVLLANSAPHNTPEEIAQDIDQFKSNLQVKYEESKNSGRQGFIQFLDFIQEQKGKIDEHYQQYKDQQAHLDEIKQKIRDMSTYLRELKEQAVDDQVGWTQDAANRANELLDSIKSYENLSHERVVKTRRDVSSHAKDSFDSAKNAASEAYDNAKEAVSENYDKAKEGFKEGADRAKENLDEAKERADPHP